jgi:hypothetical protein
MSQMKVKAKEYLSYWTNGNYISHKTYIYEELYDV